MTLFKFPSSKCFQRFPFLSALYLCSLLTLPCRNLDQVTTATNMSEALRLFALSKMRGSRFCATQHFNCSTVRCRRGKAEAIEARQSATKSTPKRTDVRRGLMHGGPSSWEAGLELT
ncbi:hypothetical protein CMEL01_07603 [Colletotrichum melonis]|uniref:Secreted protein n=1 Tax=Colletotrichum melonis TaxID=1209925 RepID=A0AAI9U254_9PEZI|nr:hypothetical protein CMEL01_07603 [Colletotrichum melonis]